MNKYFTTLLFTIHIFTLTMIHADQPHRNTTEWVQCAPQLQKCLKAIIKVPGAKELIASIQAEGPIRICVDNSDLSHRFGAFWNPDNRTICIAVYRGITEGSIIGSILFELHNAKVNAKFNDLNHQAIKGRIKKDQYIESMERLEYTNSILASQLAKKGIELGILPADAHLPTYPTFEDHYKMQRKSGHSACFGQNYESMREWTRLCKKL